MEKWHPNIRKNSFAGITSCSCFLQQKWGGQLGGNNVWFRWSSDMLSGCLCTQPLSHIWLFAVPWTIACLRGPSVHGIFQARLLEWVAISSFRGSSRPRGWTHLSSVSCIGRQNFFFFFYYCATWDAPSNLFPIMLSVKSVCQFRWLSSPNLSH